MIKIGSFGTKNEDFDQTYLITGSETQNVEDLMFHNNFWLDYKKVLVNKTQSSL